MIYKSVNTYQIMHRYNIPIGIVKRILKDDATYFLMIKWTRRFLAQAASFSDGSTGFSSP